MGHGRMGDGIELYRVSMPRGLAAWALGPQYRSLRSGLWTSGRLVDRGLWTLDSGRLVSGLCAPLWSVVPLWSLAA